MMQNHPHPACVRALIPHVYAIDEEGILDELVLPPVSLLAVIFVALEISSFILFIIE